LAGLDRLLDDHARRHSIPGAVVGVLRNGEVETASFGAAAETRFAIGSLGKSMLATAFALGGVPLDDPVTAHVPELRAASWAERTSLRDLLANRSRVPLLAELELADLGTDDDVLSRFAARLGREEPKADYWSYSNAGWCVLGRALETITGLTFEDALRATVLDPLGLEETVFTEQPAATWAPRTLGPAGSTLLSTAADLLRFAERHLDDPALEQLRVPHAEISLYGWLDAWCLGWARFDWAGGPVWGWDGVMPEQRAVLRLLPDARGAVALLTSSDAGRALYRSLFPELLAGFGVRMTEPRLEPDPRAAGDLSRFEGGYAWPDRRWEVTATDTGLVLDGPEGVLDAVAIDDSTFLTDPNDPDTPTVTFAGFDGTGRPRVLYRMIWGLPRVE
jgi:CubicO group peptidase (beta-lactamase class C family)